MKYTPAEADAVMNKAVRAVRHLRDDRHARCACGGRNGDEKAGLAVKMLVRSIRKTLGAYYCSCWTAISIPLSLRPASAKTTPLCAQWSARISKGDGH